MSLYGSKHSYMKYKHVLKHVRTKSLIGGGVLLNLIKKRNLQICNIYDIPVIILEPKFYFPRKIEMSDST